LGATQNAINVQGCTIESNAGTGIFIEPGSTVLIQGNFFEHNCTTGHVFTTPSITVKSDIITNGGASTTVLSWGSYGRGLIIEGNFVAPTATHTSFIYSGGWDNVRISGNRCNITNPTALLSFYNSPTYSYLTSNIVTNNNSDFTKNYDFTFIDAFRYASAYNIINNKVNTSNLANTDIKNWTAVLEAPAGTWSRASVALINHPLETVWELNHATSSSLWGYSVTDTDYPDREGKYYVFGVYVRTELGSTSQGAVIYAGDGVNTASYLATTAWRFMSGMFKWTGTGATLTFAVRKIGANGSIYISKPMLFEVGAGLSNVLKYMPDITRQFYGTAAPTTGTWADGDIVWNSAPATGQPMGWVCTTPGGAGTFVFTAMANL
jgi:hypothetical protein